MLISLLNILILLIVPFLMIGVIKKTKAFWAGRKGVSLFQPMWDFARLLKKDAVYSTTTSWVFRFAPVVGFVSVIFAALFVPLATGQSIISLPFGFIIFAYILAFGKFFSLIAALDTGSSFEGMGASREACFSTIVEPAFFITIASIAALSQIYSFESFKHILNGTGIYGYLIIALAVITLFIMLLIEGCRVPVDDPTTHLELTMIHEVMILDNSGADLGFITWGAAIKMFLFEALIANLIIPAGLNDWVSIGAFLLIVLLISMLIGTIESSIARFRMTHVFEFIFIMTLTALLILALVTYRIYGN
ncbi:MAG: NADH-quinone oxidoreductase subunit H [Candidatus Gastranaerophilales bacterium]|nr:NADH-quinone oxidoreductase subunit H [Candidatus Gastranaerophilales bacterium]MCM1072325.1 NADH-quinone oxidoreductase subunit H [Bacteroides sp.]